MNITPKRCAIYTRKSTEAGLEQEFNSLHAQREACLAYIKSQKHDGWIDVPDIYDDGGFSGGSMDRPALKKLLTDVAAGQVNVIVVYKVDRLTRSLIDFAKIIEMLDRHGASFVSITQQFNTTTSMGRLTLNVLLSFAQFEREVTSERIRDKIAASKKKGLWMGGVPPLGYDVADRRLVINENEAEVIRSIFFTYLEVNGVRELAHRINSSGIKTKTWTSSSGRRVVGTKFSRGRLYHLLKNPTYIGRISHKGQTYDGNHQPIISPELWTLVQERLKKQWGERSSEKNRRSPCWLVSILTDDHGNRFKSTQTKKNGRLYYYYITGNTESGDTSQGWRLPAVRIEQLVASGLIERLRDPLQLLELTGASEVTANALTTARRAVACLEKELQRSDAGRLFRPSLKSVRVSQHVIEVEIDTLEMWKLVEVLSATAMARDSSQTTRLLTIPVQLRRRGIEARIILEASTRASSVRDQKLIELIARAYVWFEQIKSGERKSINEIAKDDRISPADVSRALPLAFLAPDIVEAILEGNQPLQLTAEKLRRLAHLPTEWTDQRRALGF